LIGFVSWAICRMLFAATQSQKGFKITNFGNFGDFGNFKAGLSGTPALPGIPGSLTGLLLLPV
jgi:hypothetical protein